MASGAGNDVEITLEMRASMKEHFDQFAKGNEKMSQRQLANLLLDGRQAKDPATAADMAKKYIRKFDKDDDAQMNLDEFIKYVGKEVFKAKKVRDDWMTTTLRRAFTAADKDGSGKLCVGEIMQLTDPVAFDLQKEAVANKQFNFDDSLPFLKEAAMNFEDSIGHQVVGLFRLFDKEEDGLGKDEVKKAIPLLNDLLEAFKMVDDENSTKGRKPSSIDANAPMPKDRDLYPRDAIDLCTYIHFKRLEREVAAKK